LIRTVGAPGAHGAGMFGTQGMGVSTPEADAVADATLGFAMLMQLPNGMMFTMGLLSMMFAAGWLLVLTILSGRTLNVLGAMPIVHIS
jgi:hypothetical protein